MHNHKTFPLIACCIYKKKLCWKFYIDNWRWLKAPQTVLIKAKKHFAQKDIKKKGKFTHMKITFLRLKKKEETKKKKDLKSWSRRRRHIFLYL